MSAWSVLGPTDAQQSVKTSGLEEKWSHVLPSCICKQNRLDVETPGQTASGSHILLLPLIIPASGISRHMLYCMHIKLHHGGAKVKGIWRMSLCNMLCLAKCPVLQSFQCGNLMHCLWSLQSCSRCAQRWPWNAWSSFGPLSCDNKFRVGDVRKVMWSGAHQSSRMTTYKHKSDKDSVVALNHHRSLLKGEVL